MVRAMWLLNFPENIEAVQLPWLHPTVAVHVSCCKNWRSEYFLSSLFSPARLLQKNLDLPLFKAVNCLNIFIKEQLLAVTSLLSGYFKAWLLLPGHPWSQQWIEKLSTTSGSTYKNVSNTRLADFSLKLFTSTNNDGGVCTCRSSQRWWNCRSQGPRRRSRCWRNPWEDSTQPSITKFKCLRAYKGRWTSSQNRT